MDGHVSSVTASRHCVATFDRSLLCTLGSLRGSLLGASCLILGALLVLMLVVLLLLIIYQGFISLDY